MLSVEDTIYLVGGYTHELEPAEMGRRRLSQTEDMLTVQSYNVQTGEWLQLKENTSKSGLNLTCTLHNDGIYIMSRDVSLPTSLEHRVFLKYNIFSDAWEAFRRFPALGQNMLLCSLYLPNVLWATLFKLWASGEDCRQLGNTDCVVASPARSEVSSFLEVYHNALLDRIDQPT